MSSDEQLTVSRTLCLDASAEEVWRLLTDDAELSRWFVGCGDASTPCREAWADSSTDETVRRRGRAPRRARPAPRVHLVGRSTTRPTRRPWSSWSMTVDRRPGAAHRHRDPGTGGGGIGARACPGWTPPTPWDGRLGVLADRLTPPRAPRSPADVARPAVSGHADGRDPAPVFAALADPTRRAVLHAVAVAATGSATATELAAHLPVSRQAVVKHLQALAEAGLVAAERHGREQRYRVTPEPISGAMEWMADVGAAWDARLARLSKRLADRSLIWAWDGRSAPCLRPVACPDAAGARPAVRRGADRGDLLHHPGGPRHRRLGDPRPADLREPPRRLAR